MAKHLNAVAFMKKTGIIMIAETSTMPLTYKSKSEVVKLFDVDLQLFHGKDTKTYANVQKHKTENHLF